jgi:hypothetical protein
MKERRTKRTIVALALAVLAALSGCRSGGGDGADGAGGRASARFIADNSYIVVNSLRDVETPDDAEVTLRSAVGALVDGGTIAFAPSLDNGTIDLSIVGEAHSMLRGEVYTMVPGAGWRFDDYQPRDYGASALYAAKSLTIDASMLPSGITLRWAGGDASRARVLAVLGDLTMNRVTIRDGFASAEALDNNAAQPFTLARGGAVACWGWSSFDNCTFGENRVLGDLVGSRDRGAFGGAVYGDAIFMANCVVSGNRAEGYGAAGGGVYSVGSREAYRGNSELYECSLTGNRVTGEHAYGGGVYTDGGGIGYYNTLYLRNCTIARNVVEDNPAVPESSRSQYYCRGGGIYMSNGYLDIDSCTIAENRVTGIPFPFSGKPNLGGGAVAATIGNAHDVEDLYIRQSVLVGNTVNGAADDLFTGSLLHFVSRGYNRVGRLDCSQILVPIPLWSSLSRKHWPKDGDADGIALDAALRVAEARRHAWIRSAGTDNGSPALLWYPPGDALVDQVPAYTYDVNHVYAEYTNGYYYWSETDDPTPLLDAVMTKLRESLGAGFGTSLDYAGLHFNPIASEWPSDNSNLPWITFWRALDNEIGDRMGAVKLGDDFWASLQSVPMSSGQIYYYDWPETIYPLTFDQRDLPRPAGIKGDIGAVERLPGEGPAPAITTAAPLASGTAGVAYSQALAATGGLGPYRWSVASGSLPGGVALDNATGLLSGTPEAGGAFTFTVRVTGADDLSADRAYTVTIQEAAAPAGSGGGGCAATPGGSGGLAQALLPLLAVAILRRRRAGKPAA